MRLRQAFRSQSGKSRDEDHRCRLLDEEKLVYSLMLNSGVRAYICLKTLAERGKRGGGFRVTLSGH